MSPLGLYHHVCRNGGENLDGTCDDARLLGIRLEDNNIRQDEYGKNVYIKRRKRKRRNIYKSKAVQMHQRPVQRLRERDFGNRRTQLSLRNAKKKRGVMQELRRQHLSPCGDVLCTQDNWPSSNANGTMRIMHININGTSHEESRGKRLRPLRQRVRQQENCK